MLKKGKKLTLKLKNAKAKWESVPCDYDGKKISIVANHFSLYGVGEADVKDWILLKNTTNAYLMKGWVPRTPTLSGEEAVKITAEALNSSTPPRD